MQNDDELIKKNHNLKANTSSIIEELGMVEYIFSDKTGTLTQNELVFREMAILSNEDLILI